jgi:predicted transcriptional regulator
LTPIFEADVINAISDGKSLDIFKAVAATNCNNKSHIFYRKLKLTRKQYYNRMSRMMRVGLIERENGKYFLTSLGKVVYNAESIIGGALHYYWKLKALDSLGVSHPNTKLPPEEYSKIIDKLIDNQKIKEILNIMVNEKDYVQL